MKKLSLLLFGFIFLIGCRKEPFVNPPVSVNENLKISTSVGIKLESQFVTSEVAMNVKTETS